MGIGVQGETCGEVTEHTGHRLDVYAILQGNGCEGVAEIVEPDFRDACPHEDFKNTKSYTPRLVNYSKHYRTFSNVVAVRTITGEYLVAMKLMAYRQYKHDISDIVGILRDQQKAGDPLTFERIDTAVKNLYDGWENMPAEAQAMIQSILATEDLDALYSSYTSEEQAAKETLLEFEGEYPDVLKDDNLGDILSHLMKRQEEQI